MHRLVLIALLCCCFVTAMACPSRPGAVRSPVVRRGKPVVMTFDAVGGGQIRLADFRGKPLVLLFFTTWCVVCQVQVARLQPVRAALGNHLVAVLAVSLDLQRRLVPPFIRAAGFNFPVAYGHPSMVRRSPLGPIRGVPRTFIFDAKGRPVADFIKPVSSKVLLDTLKPLVKR